jgi:hypothetical protein
MMKCPECGIENTADSNYCRRCGAHLVISREQEATTEGYPVRLKDEPDGAPADYLPSEGTVLQIRYPLDREGELLGLQGECVTIGRHPRSDLFLDDVTVSRRHARIHIAPDGYTIEDEGSLNGTYVNRRRIEIHQLFDGDEVQIGKFRLAFLEQKAAG